MDINCDCGESFGNWKMGSDEALMPHITTANIACGFHAGDPVVIHETVALALQNDVVVGAHPGLPDLMGFGRRRMDISPDEAYAYVVYQAGAVAAMLAAKGKSLHHIKPHGIFYTMLNEDAALAEAVARAICDVCPEPKLYWPAPLDDCALPEAAKAIGIEVVAEVYFDLRYDRTRKLILERQKKPVDLVDLRKRLGDYLQTGEITAASGERLLMPAGSICVHGDGPNAPELANTIVEVLHEHEQIPKAA